MDEKMLVKMTDSMPEEQNVEELKRDKSEMRELVEEQCVDHDGEKIKEEECERLQNVETSSNKSFRCQEFTSGLTKEKDEETIERSSYMALDVKNFNTLGPSEEQGKVVEDGSSATTGTTYIEELWGKEQPSDDKELSTSMNVEVSNLWHDELKVINTEESVSLVNKEKNVEPNATKQDTDEILNKEEKLNDELETAPQIEATEASLHEEEFKDEKSVEVTNRKIDVKNPEDIKMKDKQTDKGTADASSATQLTAEEETGQIEEVPAAQDEVQCIKEVLGHDELDTQLPMQDVPEVSEAGTDDNLVEGESQSGTHNDELERVHEDKDTMTTVQTNSSDGESNYIISSLQPAKTSEKKKTQALPDVNITQDNALMGVERESGLEKPLDEVYQNIEAREEINNRERENTCQEELTVKEKFEEDEKEYEMKDGFVHNYQDPSIETLPANGEDDNTEEDAGDLPAAQESSEETIPKGEMQESGVTSSRQDLSNDTSDNIHQQICESEPENFMNNSELISEGPSSKTVAEAEVTNTDVLASSVKVLTTVTSPSISQATIQEDTEEAMGHKEPIEERIEVVDNNEDHDRHTYEASIEVVIENMIHEDSTKFEDTNPEDEENDKNTAGVSSMEQLEGEKLSEGDELVKEKVNFVLAADSHKCLEDSKTEETQYCVLEKEKHEMENDPNLVFETIIKAKHSVVTRDTEDEHLEKQECIKDNYNPHDKLKETVKEKDENLQDIGQKHEEDLNYPHEQEILETANTENNIVDDGGHTSQTAEMVLESGSEQKSQDRMDEMETTKIDKSIFDDNFSNMNATNELREETAMPNEMIANTNENEFVEATIQEKLHEDPTDSICKEKNQNMTNDIDMVQEEMESKNSEKASQFVFAEHQHNKISGSETACINPSAEDNSKEEAFGDLCTSQASEENTQKQNDPEDTNEDIPALKNDYESHDSNAGAAEVVVEKEIHQTEEQRCKEDETAAGMSLPQDNKIQREKTDARSESEASESPTLSVDPEICPSETTTNKASLEVNGSEDKLGNPSDVVSDKTIVDETSISTRDIEETDLLEKQKESFQEKAEVLMPPTIGSEDNIRNPSDAVYETIMAESSTSSQDVEDFFEKQEKRFHEMAEVSMLKIVGSEDKVENPSDVISEKTIMAETIASNQDAKEMDLLGKQEESFKEKGEVPVLLEHVVARTGTDNPNYKEDDASLQFIKDAEGENQEESLEDINSTYAEQTYGTINISNNIEREPSQKLEFVSKSALEDEEQGANKGKQAGKIKSSLYDDSLKRTIPETLEPSDSNENAKDETTQDEYIGNNQDSCLLVEEIVHSAISEKHTEGQSSAYEEQTYQSANLEGIIQGDVSEDKKDIEKLEIPSESLIEIEGKKEMGESVFTEMDSSIGDESLKMMHEVAEKVKDEKNQSRANEDPQSPDSHALVLPIPSESNDEKYEESSKSVFKEHCHQTISVGEKTEADVHKERTDSESLHIIEEKVEIPENVADSDDSQTVKAKGEDTLEEDISNIPNTGELLQKTTNNEVGEDHEYDNNISNSEDTLITDINKEKDKNNQLDTESENCEKASWLVTEEHQHNKISGLEVNIDPSTGGNSMDKVFGDLCTSQASKEENTQKATHQEEANEDVPALSNDNEGRDSNAGVAEVVIETEIHQRKEELRCNEDEIATGMSLLHDDEIQREKIDTSELEASESPTISVNPEIYLDETTADKASLEVIGSEDQIGNPSDVVSEKTIVDETSTSTQDVEEMDLLEKQKESFQEKPEVIMQPTIGSEDEIRNPSDAVPETIMAETSTSAQDVEEMIFLEKQEENFHEKDEVSMLQIVGSEDKVESPFEVLSEKIIMAETIASNEEAKEMDLLGKQEESFQEKAEVTMLLEIEVAKMGIDNPSYKADGASLKFNNEAEGENQEESLKDLNCTYAEQTYGTINIGNKIEREASQELEFVSKSANEDEDQGANTGNQVSKIKNSLDDGSLKRTIPETLEPSNWNENANDETIQDQHIGNNRDSCLLVDEIVHSAINEKHAEGHSSVDEEQTDKSANLEGIIQGNVNEDKKRMEKLGIPSGSFVKIKGREEIGESVFTEMDSSIDHENSKMIHVVAEQVKDEEDLSKTVEEHQFLDSHALVLPRTSEPNDENYKESSKSVFEEQCLQTTNLEEKTEADVHKERTDSDSLQILEEKVKAEDALEEDIINTPNSGELVEKATDDGVGEDHEYENNITNSEDTIITDINKEKEKIDPLDTESDLRHEDHSQIMHGDKESVKVEEAPSLENETQSSTVKQMTNDAESGSRVEKNVKEMAYELKYDEILEHNSICESIDEDVQKKEEPLNNFIEKSVSNERANCGEADSGRKMLDEEAKDANFVSVVCKENQKFEDAKPTNTCSDQDNEIKEVNDGIKSETATDEVEVSQIVSAAQKSESLAEMKPDKSQLPDYGSQTLNANLHEDQTCTTRGNNNDRDILELINMDEHTKNKDENTNKILDSSGLTDEAHRNLDGDWDGSTIEIDYSKDEIPNQEVDSELRSIEQNREVRKDTNPIKVETSVNENHSFITQYKEPEAVDLNYEQGIANSNNNDNLPVFTAFDEKAREEVQKKHDKDPESSSEGQIDGHIKNIYLATLKEQDKIVELEKDTFSMSSEQNGNESIGTDILQNDQMEANSSAKRIATPMEGDDHCHDGKEVSEVMGNSLQNDAKVNDANVSCSSMQPQGMGGDDLNMASVEEIETFESAKKEENTMDQEALDLCPSEIKLIVAAEVKHLYPQRTKIEERTLTEAKIEESNLLSQEVLERTNGLSTVEALFEGNMPKSTSKILSENQSHDVPGHINIEEMAVLEKQNEEMQKVQTHLFDEVENEKIEEENNIHTKQIESETINTNDTADEERHISKVASDKAKPELENPLHEVHKGRETAPGTENIYEERIETKNLEEKLLIDENKMLIKSAIESEGENQTNEPFDVSGSIECAIPDEEIVKAINTGDEVAKVGVQYEASKCHMVDSLYVSDELFEETTKRETSGSYKQMTPTELESLEKGNEISTQNDEITETSVKLDESSRCDTKETMQLEAPSSTVSNLEKVESDMYTETKIEAKEDAFESTSTARVGDITANEQFQEEENESKKDKEPEANWKPEVTDSTPKDEVEICDSKLAQIGLSEKTEKMLPIDDEDLIKSLSAENAKQEIAEKFGKIADYKPIGCTEKTCDANELGIDLSKEKGGTAEYPAEIEKLMHIAGDTASVPEIHVNDGKVPDDIPCVLSVSEPSGEDTVVKENSVTPTEFSNLQSDEDDRKDSLSVEVTRSKEISHKIPVMPDPELQSPEEERERVQLEEEASCEAVEFSDLQDEEKQQAEGNNLPVSQLLMDHILSEEKVKPDKACDVEAEDNTLHGGEQHDAGIPQEERILVTDETSISRHSVGPDELQTTPGKFKSENKIHEKLDEGDQNGAKTEKHEFLVSFSPENATGKTSISEDNVGQEKLEIGSPLVEENQVCASNEKTEIPVEKDDVKPKNSPRDSSPTMPMSEDVKDVAPNLTEISTCEVENDSREPTLTEKRNTENKMDIEDCILTASVQTEEVQETVLEKYPKEQTNKKNEEVQNSDVLPLVLETSHEDNLREEGSKEGKEIPQDVRKRGKASYEVIEGQYPSNAELVGETKSLVHNKETLLNPKYDQNGKSSSNLKDALHGQTSEIESEVKMVENEDEGNDGFTGNQVPHEKKKSTGKAYLSELQDVDQSNLAVKSTDQTLEVAKNLPDGKILALHTDEQVAVGITQAQADEDNSEGENDEYKPEESGNDARVAVEARDADLKPAHKKSHNILSGVGSKFKHSLSKVKKVITGKSSHSKTSPAK